MTQKALIMLVLSVLLATGAVVAAGSVQETPTQTIEGITAQEVFASTRENYVFMVYFTGIGCRHCERTTPMVLEQLPREYANLVIIEYEIYEKEQNALMFNQGCLSRGGVEFPREFLAIRKLLSTRLKNSTKCQIAACLSKSAVMLPGTGQRHRLPERRGTGELACLKPAKLSGKQRWDQLG